MAKVSKLRANTPEVQQFLDLSGMLIQAASDYAGLPESDPETQAMLRQIQVACAALSTALATVANMPRPMAQSGG